ncbi:hypothetical protein PVNG_02400 [Plasmodium vivax North Korean]|uniref:DNA methylase adenine-specific domain-containing protein n=1 Tax=Plasmodium vivax North Korean TaxID=1035514 RepID=A0A0J9TND6_PLAVI|nr:hypothetical protein PVNG_02400 [Plasmodium vivax North Korean]
MNSLGDRLTIENREIREHLGRTLNQIFKKIEHSCYIDQKTLKNKGLFTNIDWEGQQKKSDDKVFFIDGDQIVEENNNFNSEEENQINLIIDLFRNREDRERFSKLIESLEIKKNRYNLTVRNYIEGENSSYNSRRNIDSQQLLHDIEDIVRQTNIQRKEVEKIVLEIEKAKKS